MRDRRDVAIGLIFALAGACGDDDGGLQNLGGSGSDDGCYFEDDDTCIAAKGISVVCDGLLGGVSKTCPTANLEGTCAVPESEDESAQTVFYYEGEDGAAWGEAEGSSAKEDCELDDGTYKAK
jgi:hypothetical protein